MSVAFDDQGETVPRRGTTSRKVDTGSGAVWVAASTCDSRSVSSLVGARVVSMKKTLETVARSSFGLPAFRR